MEFKCSSCNYVSFHKIDLERHLNKQKKCGENSKIIEVPIEIECEFCNKSYKNMRYLNQHIKICKVKKSNIEKELEKVKKQLEEANKKLSSININSNNTINNTINNITIQLRPYDDPKLPDDMDDVYEDAWEKMKSVQTYIERVHFSSEFPENHNMCITNLRTKLAAKVFNGEKWETKDQNKILDEIIKNVVKHMDKWININKKKREKYRIVFNEYLETEGKSNFDKEMRDELKLLLYDNFKNGTVDIKSTSKPSYIEDLENE